MADSKRTSTYFLGPSSEQEVANNFNQFFVYKISTLKANIDPNQVKDPLEKLEEKLKNINLIGLYCIVLYLLRSR